MKSEDENIFELLNQLSEEESMRLLDEVTYEGIQLNEVQKKRIEHNVIGKIKIHKNESSNHTAMRGLVVTLTVAVVSILILVSTVINNNTSILHFFCQKGNYKNEFLSTSDNRR